MTVSLASLLIQETKAAIYARALAFATTVGLPVTSWQAGDPTRSLYHVLSETLENLETVVAGYCASGFLDHAEADWLRLLAEQVFGYTASSATYATTTVRLTNIGGGYYPILAGDVTVKSATTGKTYRNTTAGTLASGSPGTPTTLDLTFVADESGSDSNAPIATIDTMVTTLLEVSCSNAAAALANDDESEASIRAACRAKLGTLSATGPRDAYDFVARDDTLTGTTEVTRSRTIGDSATGLVTCYIAGAAGAVGPPVVALVQAAVEEWCTPLCVTPTVVSATGLSVDITYTMHVYSSVGKTTTEMATDVNAALVAMFANRPIGGDIIPPATTGNLYESLIESTIRGVYPDHCFKMTSSAPGADVAMAINEVAMVGTVSDMITLVADP